MTALLLLLTLALPAPTELPELRTETSRTFDNHDGTYTARIECAGPPAIEGDTIPCYYSGCLNAWIDEQHGGWLYHWHEPEMKYQARYVCGLMQYDLSTIPDSSVIDSASCHWYQYDALGYDVRTILRHADIDPDTTTWEELRVALWYGSQVSQPVSHTYIGWVHHMLDQTGLERIESCLQYDRIVLSIYIMGGYQAGWAYGTGMPELSPRIEVNYHLSNSRAPDVHRVPNMTDLFWLGSLTMPYPVVAGKPCTLSTTLHNHGPAVGYDASITAYVDGVLQDSQFVARLGPQENLAVSVPMVLPPTEAWRKLTLHCTDDADSNWMNDVLAESVWVFPAGTYEAQGFEEPSFPPPGWVAYDTVGSWSWDRYGAYWWCGHYSAGRLHGEGEDWLISPLVSPVPQAADSIGFHLYSVFASDLSVWALSAQEPDSVLGLLYETVACTTGWRAVRLGLDEYDGRDVFIGLLIDHPGNPYTFTFVDDVYFQRIDEPAVAEERAPKACASSLALTPNPTSRRASISYSLPITTAAELSVLDISGREVWTERLAGERAGTIQLPLLPAGVYLVRLQSASFTATEKLVVQR